MPCSGGQAPRNPPKFAMSQITFMKEKRTKRIEICVTPEEYEQLISRKTKPRLAEWLREVGLSERRTIPIAKADPKLLYELNRIGVNLNQIARQLNTSKQVDNLEILSALVDIERRLGELKP